MNSPAAIKMKITKEICRSARSIDTRYRPCLLYTSSVILDFGFWAKEQREEKFREAQALGAGFAICYVHAPLEELCRRLEHRVQAGRKDVFQAISREDMERWAALFQPPDAGELRGEYGPG